jgi:hypothetical protein
LDCRSMATLVWLALSRNLECRIAIVIVTF